MCSVGCIVGSVLALVLSSCTASRGPSPPPSPLLVYYSLPPPAKPEGGGHYGLGILRIRARGAYGCVTGIKLPSHPASCFEVSGPVPDFKNNVCRTEAGSMHPRTGERYPLRDLSTAATNNLAFQRMFEPPVQWNHIYIYIYIYKPKKTVHLQSNTRNQLNMYRKENKENGDTFKNRSANIIPNRTETTYRLTKTLINISTNKILPNEGLYPTRIYFNP